MSPAKKGLYPTQSCFLKDAVICWANERMQKWKDGKIHAMDCIDPIHNLFVSMNEVERLEMMQGENK